MFNGFKRSNHSTTVIADKESPSAYLNHVKAQLGAIRRKRAVYKAGQEEVRTTRAHKEDLIYEIESAERDLRRIETVGLYIKRKIEFYSAACRAIQAEIDQDNFDHGNNLPKNLLSVSAITDSNAELLALATVYKSISLTEQAEKQLVLRRRVSFVVHYQKHKTDFGHQTTVLEEQITNQETTLINLVKDRDALRIAMHYDSTYSYNNEDISSQLMRHELLRSFNVLEHHIAFVVDLDVVRTREFASASRVWLANQKQDNQALYTATMTAWKWTLTSRLASELRHATFTVFKSPVCSEHLVLLNGHTDSVTKLCTLSESQRSAFILHIKSEYGDILSSFLKMSLSVTEHKETAGDNVARQVN